jgi:hypothetical protein
VNRVAQMFQNRRVRHIEDLRKWIGRVKGLFFEWRQNLDIKKINWRPSRPGFVIQKLTLLPNV